MPKKRTIINSIALTAGMSLSSPVWQDAFHCEENHHGLHNTICQTFDTLALPWEPFPEAKRAFANYLESLPSEK